MIYGYWLGKGERHIVMLLVDVTIENFSGFTTCELRQYPECYDYMIQAQRESAINGYLPRSFYHISLILADFPIHTLQKCIVKAEGNFIKYFPGLNDFSFSLQNLAHIMYLWSREICAWVCVC